VCLFDFDTTNVGPIGLVSKQLNYFFYKGSAYVCLAGSKKNGLKRPFPTFEIFRARTSGTDSDLNQQSLKNFQFPISHFQLEWRADW
jgi:hypothetical protein